MMPTTLKAMIDRLPADRQQRVKARAQELIAEEMTLRDLRRARDLTQERMAERLHIGQDGVSRLEKRTDLLLSTLRSYVNAMGGTLELVVRFPDRPAVVVSGLSDLAPEPEMDIAEREAALLKPVRKEPEPLSVPTPKTPPDRSPASGA